MSKRRISPVIALLSVAIGLMLAAVPAVVAETEEDAATAAWMAAGTPGEAHGVLSEMCGSWKVTTKSWQDPAAPPIVTEGKTVRSMIMDGRYLQEDLSSDFMGMPFKGLGLMGYDNLKQEYVGIWLDSMSTSMMYYTGQYDPDMKSIETVGEFIDPVTKQTMHARTVTTLVDENRHTFDFFATGPDGAEFKSMEMVYERE